MSIQRTDRDLAQYVNRRPVFTTLNLWHDTDKTAIRTNFIRAGTLPRPQGHLCGRGEEIDDPGKGCKNLQDSWRFSSMRRQGIM